MTQYERMVNGLIYDPGDPEIMNEQVPFQDRQWEFNQLKPSDYEKKQQYISWYSPSLLLTENDPVFRKKCSCHSWFIIAA